MDGVSVAGVTVDTILEYVGAAEDSLRYKSLAPNTWRGYKTGLRRWIAFARLRGLDARKPDAEGLADCIEHYHETGAAATAIDQMSTALSTVFAWKTGERLGKKEQVVSLIKAVYVVNKVTPLQRYYFDPELLLDPLEKESDVGQTTVRMLRKLATLLVLRHAMRFTEMESIMRREVEFDKDNKTVAFLITLKTEQRRRRRIMIGEVKERPGVCVVKTLRQIIGMSRKTTVPELFVMEDGNSKMTASQISLMVKEVMREAGIPEEVNPYNCKHVGLTKAWKAGASEDELRDVARWVKNSEQFRKYYRLKDSGDKVVKLIIAKDKEE
jgi:site-specific recombinase XerD